MVEQIGVLVLYRNLYLSFKDLVEVFTEILTLSRLIPILTNLLTETFLSRKKGFGVRPKQFESNFDPSGNWFN